MPSLCTHRNPLRKWKCSIKYPCMLSNCSKRRPCKSRSFTIAFPCRCRQQEHRGPSLAVNEANSSISDDDDSREFEALVLEKAERLERDIKDLRRVLKRREADRRHHI